MLATIREDYATEWLGSFAATWFGTRGCTTISVELIRKAPVCIWRGQEKTLDTTKINTALQFVREICAIAPENFAAIHTLFCRTRPSKASLRTVLSYIGGTSTTLFLLPIFGGIVPEKQIAHHLFTEHFERVFGSGEPQPVVLRMFLSMVPRESPEKAFVHRIASASLACVQNMQVFIQSHFVDPGYGGEKSLLVLACTGGHYAVVEALLPRCPRELVLTALRVANHQTIVPLLLGHLRQHPPEHN